MSAEANRSDRTAAIATTSDDLSNTSFCISGCSNRFTCCDIGRRIEGVRLDAIDDRRGRQLARDFDRNIRLGRNFIDSTVLID